MRSCVYPGCEPGDDRHVTLDEETGHLRCLLNALWRGLAGSHHCHGQSVFRCSGP